MTILVTGAAGFIGRHVMDHLAAAGQPARGFDLSPVSVASDHVVGDITDPGAVAAAMAGATGVIHIAGIGVLWRKDIGDYDRVNVGGTRVVVDAARTAGVDRFVHVSSATTLVGRSSRKGAMVTVDDAPPIDALFGAYPRSKRRSEAVVADAGFATGVIALPTAPIGPGHDPAAARSTEPMITLTDILTGKIPAFFDFTFNLIDVRDLAAGLVAGLTAPSGRYVVCGHTLGFGAFVEHVCGIAQRKGPRARVPYPVALAAASAQEAVANRTGTRPQATAAGVRLARKSIRFDPVTRGHRIAASPRPLASTLQDAVNWLKDVRAV